MLALRKMHQLGVKSQPPPFQPQEPPFKPGASFTAARVLDLAGMEHICMLKSPVYGQSLRLHAPPAGIRHKCGAAACIRRQPRSVRLAAAAVSTDFSITKHLNQLRDRCDLTKDEAKKSLEYMLENPVEAEIAAFLCLLSSKGETTEEVSGLVSVLRSKMVAVHTPHDVVDIVGTGGDDIGSINISTGASVLTAAAGAKVGKHGSRSTSSPCGSADVLEELGVAIDLGPDGVSRCIDAAGIGFMLSVRYHPAMKAIGPVRKKLKMRSVFNLMGPMLNPAGAKYSLVGVSKKELLHIMAKNLLVEKSLVVHSMGLDELTPMGPADVVEVSGGKTKSYTLNPQDVGIPSCEVEDLKGGDKPYNAAILRDIFGGAQGHMTDALCLNAGYALAACGKAENPIEGVAMAQEAQRAGKGGDVLSKWIEVSRREKELETASN